VRKVGAETGIARPWDDRSCRVGVMDPRRRPGAAAIQASALVGFLCRITASETRADAACFWLAVGSDEAGKVVSLSPFRTRRAAEGYRSRIGTRIRVMRLALFG
jgi:hypothetical protein